MIGSCTHKNGSRTLPDQSSVSASFHCMEAGAAISPCSLLMITVETENYNLISQDFYDKTVFSLTWPSSPVPAATPVASSGMAVIPGKSSLRTASFPCVSQGSAAGTADVLMQSFFLPSSLTLRSPSLSMFLSHGAVKTGNPSVLYSADRPTLTKTTSRPWPVLTADTGGIGSGLSLPAPLPSGIW